MRPLRVVVLDEDAQDALELTAVEDQQGSPDIPRGWF
jgi:hypothetical protein